MAAQSYPCGDVGILFLPTSRARGNGDVYVPSRGKWWTRMLTDVKVGLWLLLGLIIKAVNTVYLQLSNNKPFGRIKLV